MLNISTYLILIIGFLLFGVTIGSYTRGGGLNYSQMYCEDCKKWYIPKNIGESNKCPMCGSNKVHGDE